MSVCLYLFSINAIAQSRSFRWYVTIGNSVVNEKNVINYNVTIVGQSLGIDQHCGECTVCSLHCWSCVVWWRVSYMKLQVRGRFSESHRSSADATRKWCSRFMWGTFGLMDLFLCPTGDISFITFFSSHIIFLWLSCKQNRFKDKDKKEILASGLGRTLSLAWSYNCCRCALPKIVWSRAQDLNGVRLQVWNVTLEIWVQIRKLVYRQAFVCWSQQNALRWAR